MNKNNQGLLGFLFLVILVFMCILTFSPSTIPMTQMQNGITLVILGLSGLGISYLMRKNKKNNGGDAK